MDSLKLIYERITYLRQHGMKMKEIASRAEVSPSILSAIYSTVIPAYTKRRAEGMDEHRALDEALVWVNNVSKKKLLALVQPLLSALAEMETPDNADTTQGGTGGNAYAMRLGRRMKEAATASDGLTGTYLSYSMSSAADRLKIEPYLITPSEDGSCLRVVHNNAYGTTHEGFALMNGRTHMYLYFNETRAPQLSLFQICLRIPMYDRPPFLRGLYMCFDYNFNPIARRILFVKQSDDTDTDKFASLKGCLKRKDELDDKELTYYRYTCGAEDVLRMGNILHPTMTEEDLEEEKDSLRRDNTTGK